MNRDKKYYTNLAKQLEAKFRVKQEAELLANLNRKNAGAFNNSKEKILADLKVELINYQDEKSDYLGEEEVNFVIDLVRKEIWGYGIIDDLIHDKDISDIKLYNEGNIRIKVRGQRKGTDLQFEDANAYKAFINKILERNKVNLGTANAIQTFTDSSQEDFILRITVISSFLVTKGAPVMAIRKIPKKKKTLRDLEADRMFDKRKGVKKEEVKMRKLIENKEVNKLLNLVLTSKGVLFTGKGGSGKTSLMNGLISEIPKDEAIMICQENEELFDLNHPDLFACHVKTNQGDSKVSYDLGDLTRAALLADLDRVIVGEVKQGSEAAGLSKASMTGHKCMTSVHGDSCEMAVEKMADYISQATGYTPTESLKQLLGFEYVIHLKDFNVDEIVRITGWDNKKNSLVLERVYSGLEE